MAWGVEESDLSLIIADRDLICTDVLGNAASFAGNNISCTQSIKQRRLAMIDMAHNGHNWRPRILAFFCIRRTEETFFNIGLSNTFHCMTKVRRDELCGISVERGVGCNHLALLHQFTNELYSAHGHALSEVLNRNGFRDDHFARDMGIAAAALHPALLFFFPGAFDRCQGTLAVFITFKC